VDADRRSGCHDESYPVDNVALAHIPYRAYEGDSADGYKGGANSVVWAQPDNVDE